MIALRNPMRRNLSVFLALLMLTLGACGTNLKSRETLLTETLRTYAAAIRWGTIEQAETFIDPAYRTAHPLSALDLERYKQVRFTAYNDRAPVPVNDNEVRQIVEIGLVNVNSQSSRSVIDQQVWKYDEPAKRWLLTTGLPDITRRD